LVQHVLPLLAPMKSADPLLISTCRIPDDCIDNKRYPLFIAREVMQALIDQLQP